MKNNSGGGWCTPKKYWYGHILKLTPRQSRTSEPFCLLQRLTGLNKCLFEIDDHFFSFYLPFFLSFILSIFSHSKDLQFADSSHRHRFHPRSHFLFESGVCRRLVHSRFAWGTQCEDSICCVYRLIYAVMYKNILQFKVRVITCTNYILKILYKCTFMKSWLQRKHFELFLKFLKEMHLKTRYVV